MAKSNKRKIILAIIGCLFVLVALLPFVLGVMLRGTVEEKLSESFNVPVKLGGLSISLLFPGATLWDLEIGDPSPEAGNEPLAKIKRLRIQVPMGTVFGGDLQIISLDLEGTAIHIGCNEKGESTFTKFLAKQKSGSRSFPIPIDAISSTDFSMYMHVPKVIMAPDAGHAPEPVVVKLSSLEVIDLLLPAHGKPASKGVWTNIKLEGLTVRSPLKIEVKVSNDGGEPIEEGITLASAQAQMSIPTTLEQPLQIQGVLLKGLRVKNVIASKDLPETLERLHIARGICLVTPATDSKATGMVLGNGWVYLSDVAVQDSEIEVDGFDANGKPAYYRLNALEIQGNKLAMGPGMDTTKESPGSIKIESTSKSSEGDGHVLLEWKDIVGHFPTWSFEKRLEIEGVPLTPWSVRVERNMDARVAGGKLSTSFTGKTIDGNLNWDGSITLSKETKLVGKGAKGKVTQWLTKFATGDPIKTIRIRGTLLKPEHGDPDFVGSMVMNLLSKAFFNRDSGAVSAFTSGMGAAVNQGVRETKKFFGGLFGGDKKEEEK